MNNFIKIPYTFEDLNIEPILYRTLLQSPVQYVRANESSVLDIVHNPSEHAEIFLPNEGGSFTSVGTGSTTNLNGLSLKRRASDA